MANALQQFSPLRDPRGEMSAPPRNKLLGLLADALTQANTWATKNDPRYADKRENQTMGLLADAVSLGSIAKTADRLSYGDALTNARKANVPFLKPETADVAMMAPLSPRNALAALSLGMGGVTSHAGMIPAELAKVARMQEMGLERGWFRGGLAPIESKRTGPWYTKSEQEAAGYAKGGDVREYAIPAGGYLEAQRGYSPKLAHDVAAILDDPFYGKGGANLAKELRTYQPGEGITGGQLWQALEANLGGNDAAAAVLQKLGAFKGVKGVTGPHEAYVFKNGAVRDANKAAFDPARYTEDNILAGITGGAIVGGTGLAALRDKQGLD